MEKLKMQTKNIADEKFEKLREMFPNAITETVDANGQIIRAIDKDKLSQEINNCVIDEKEERFQFSWPDKKKAILLANSSIRKTLRPKVSESKNFDTTKNLYIEGDNLDALKLLRETYLGKVKMIYIDPPYNTGNDFIYEDDFSQETEEYLAISGQLDKEGNRLVQNTESNGRFHTDWLNMIYPRIKVAKDLLADDGAIFISIDETEIGNLKNLCNDIFNEKNYINTFMWLHGKGKKDSWSRTLQQYIVVYAKNKSELAPWVEKKICDYEFKNPDNDPKGPWFSGSLSFTEERSNPDSEKYYSITSPSGIVWTRQWMVSKEEMDILLKNGDVSFGKAPDYDGVPRSKIRPGATIEVIPNNIIDDCNTTRGAENYLRELFGSDCFSYPKPYELMEKLISYMDLNNSIVLDFFSGSATTAEGVIRNNIAKKSNTQFIMIQLPENLDEALEAATSFTRPIIKNAINYLDKIKKPHNLCEIGKERIRLCENRIRNQFDALADGIDFGFRDLYVDDSNFKDVYYSPDEITQELIKDSAKNIVEGRTNEDLLFQTMLDLGIKLSSKIEKKSIDGKEVFYVEDNYLIACFDNELDENVITKLAQEKPYYFVIKDSSMINDSIVTNFEQIFKTYSKQTILRVI